MAQNDFKSFAVGVGANVTPQADWETLAALVTGFQSGKASSAQINKAIRQASFIAAALAQYTSDKTGGDVLDDGDQAAFITKMAAAFGKDFQPLDGTLTALAALTGAADKLPYFNGADTAALTALTAFAREILAQTDAAGVLSKLGLGGVSSGMFPIGMPFYWPSATMPNLLLPEWSGMTFLKWNGATFSATAYPKLALVIPSLTLTESRGEFIRNWDDGRGIDSGRTLLSSQLDAMQVITGTFATDNVSGTIPPTGAFYNAGTSTAGMTNDTNGMTMGFDSSKVARTSTETRSRNIAFNFLVRAA